MHRLLEEATINLLKQTPCPKSISYTYHACSGFGVDGTNPKTWDITVTLSARKKQKHLLRGHPCFAVFHPQPNSEKEKDLRFESRVISEKRPENSPGVLHKMPVCYWMFGTSFSTQLDSSWTEKRATTRRTSPTNVSKASHPLQRGESFEEEHQVPKNQPPTAGQGR